MSAIHAKKPPQNMTKPFRAPSQNAAFDATLGSQWGQHRYVTSVPQNNTGSHFYVKKSQKTCDCLCQWYGANSEDAGRNECRRFYVFFLGWPCLANTPIRESQSLHKNIIAGKFDFTVVIFQHIQHLLLVQVWWSKQAHDRVDEIVENQNLC